MPELPEVETTRRGIRPHLVGHALGEVIIREPRLRRPVSASLPEVAGDRVTDVRRRGKYLVLALAARGSLLVHLGMSGSLRITPATEEFRRHDHVILGLDDGRQLRFHDPRRFGVFLHLPTGDPLAHPLLASLGPEPLGDDFTPLHLQRACRGRRTAVKLVIMNAAVVVGVGNIYANEALFRAGIRPRTAAGRLSGPKIARLTEAVREVLHEAITQGGTTLRDFVNSDGEPGYFRQRLFVYDRAGEPCRVCGEPIRHAVVGQRATYWCARCQR